MSKASQFWSSVYPVFKIVLSLVWLSNLSDTDAYFSVYVLIAFSSLFVQFRQRENVAESQRKFLLSAGMLSVMLSLFVLFANYPIFTTIGDPALIGRSTSIMVNMIDFLLSALGGICVFYPLISKCFVSWPIIRSSDSIVSRKWIWPAVFAIFLGINLLHLFLVEYPGNVTEDPFTQISEMVSGVYSNFNTFWHTMIFQCILTAGYSIFGDINAGVALFCIFQIVILSFAFTYSLATMAHWGAPTWFLICVFLIYGFVPYNIALSITIWKDVLFAAGCLLILTSLFRITQKIGSHRRMDQLIFVVGSLLFFLSRTNAWVLYLITLAAAVVTLRKNKQLLGMMCILALIGWAFLNPVLAVLGIPQGDIVESLSIPIQQVSRVIAEECPLTDGETELLSRIVDLEEVPELYVHWLSDPMKVEVRSKDAEYFYDHLPAYRDLWIRLGIKYPWQYMKAWIDQTKGYWNAGYPYAMYSEIITDNHYGVEKQLSGSPVASLFRLYFGLSRHVIFFEPLHSIGLYVWILLLCFFQNLRRRQKTWILTVPLLVLVLGLWFGTPVYCSFRYVYPLFVSLPLIVASTAFCKSS